MSRRVALHVEECFIEAAIFSEEGTPIHCHRWFMPHQVHFAAMSDWSSSFSGNSPNQWFLTTTRPKVYSEKGLGAPPIIIVDQPYEEWLLQESKYNRDRRQRSHWNTKYFALQRDRIFAVSGQLPLSPEASDAMIAKFLLMEYPNVVLLPTTEASPLHAPHGLLAQLEKSNLLHFLPPPAMDGLPTEARWWRAVLDAFSEHCLAEIMADWQHTQKPEQVYALMDDQLELTTDLHPRQSFGFGFAHYRALAACHPDSVLLYCGLEEWVILNTGEQESVCQLAFADVALNSIQHLRCDLQPTSEIGPGLWGHTEIKSIELGYEPGPILLGKGLKPTVLDLLLQGVKDCQVTGLPLVTEDKTLHRWNESLRSLASSHGKTGHSISHLEDVLRQQLSDSLISDLIKFNPNRQKVILIGPLAPHVLPLLEVSSLLSVEMTPHPQWQLLEALTQIYAKQNGIQQRRL